ncbi:hypothetical protein [Paraburkholderia fungorum]|uniref:hypothetical protein n=1 Tax=Paraburkholderia fungorum TaxID=134537 RepID=UPI0004AB3D68|nr:hypothetical protein [Paraburkholderia fungorum]KFX62547.1 hypothetical protein KBK24_0125580 [Burkholderia sp. K24]USX05019.1 hypothetical protein NHH62_02530 [Paraburkholderia fungorum]
MERARIGYARPDSASIALLIDLLSAWQAHFRASRHASDCCHNRMERDGDGVASSGINGGVARLGFEAAAESYRFLESAAHSGKVVIDMGA